MGRIVGLQFKEVKQVQQNPPAGQEGTQSGQHIELKEMNAEQLMAYATEHHIDIGNATSAAGILKKIIDAEKKTARKDE